MSTWSFYRLSDGVFTGRRQSGHRLVGIPQECGSVEGAFDHQSQRVDVAALANAGEKGAAESFVVDYKPPQPSPDHEWRANVANGRPRWVKKTEVVQRESEERRAKRFIADLELAHRVMEAGRLSASELATLQRFALSREESQQVPAEPSPRSPE